MNNEYTLKVFDQEQILKIAQQLMEDGFLIGKREFPYLRKKVICNYVHGNELKFWVRANDLWTNAEMAEVIAEAFNRYGFKARTKNDYGCIWVQTNDFLTDMEREVDNSFKKVIKNEE